MGTDYFIACHQCKEFISLHKWPVIGCARNTLLSSFPHLSSYYALEPCSPYKLYDLDTSCHKVQLVGENVLEIIDFYQPEQEYIQKLIPTVKHFVTLHTEHKLFLACDIGGLPWDFGEPSFVEWKEVPGHFYFYAYLPRNLVEVHKIRKWDEALALMQKECRWVLATQLSEGLKAIHASFEKRVGKDATTTQVGD